VTDNPSQSHLQYFNRIGRILLVNIFGKKEIKNIYLKFQVMGCIYNFLTWKQVKTMNTPPPHPFPHQCHFVAMSQADGIQPGMRDTLKNKQLQSHLYIYSPNGILLLNIPVKHRHHQRTAYSK
jgi:hypothetical protein